MERGVTLIELVVTIAIAAILISIAVPSYRYVTTTNRISSEINGLIGDMQFARAEAIKEGQPVTVCVSSDGASCDATGTTWSEGWIVFSDMDGNQSVDTGDVVLRVQKSFASFGSGDSFTGGTGSDAVAAVTFNREGFTSGLTTTATLTMKDPTSTATYTRCLTVSLVGLMTTVSPPAAGCTTT